MNSNAHISSSAHAALPTLRIDSLVVYENNGRPIVAEVKNLGPTSAQVLNMQGKGLPLPMNRLHLLPDKPGFRPASSDLLKILEEQEEAAGKLSLREIWELLGSGEEAQEFTCSTLTETYFGQDTLENHLSLWLALCKDRVFFKRRQECFEPRSASHVEELLKAEKARLERVQARSLLMQYFQALRTGTSSDKAPHSPQAVLVSDGLAPECKPLLDALFRVACEASNRNHHDTQEADELCALYEKEFHYALGKGAEYRALALLRHTRLIHENFVPAYIRYALRMEFPKAGEIEIAQILQNAQRYSLDSWRRDLRHLDTVTIDDTSTQDMDDALSLERNEQGFVLGIHITDLASRLPLDSALAKEAAQRASSLYTPDRVVPMLPQALSSDAFSLRAGLDRPCISCLCTLNAQYELQGFEIVPSLIQVKEKLGYEQVEEQLETGGNALLQRLFEASMSYQEKRLAQGALELGKVYRSVVLERESDTGAIRKLRLESSNEASPARALVAECMILANECFARFASDNKIPWIYRTQEASESHAAISEQLPERVQEYLALSGMKRSIMKVTPGLHYTLGLQYYCQLSSPARRYLDYILQCQLFAHLRTQALPFDTEALEKIIEESQPALQRIQLATREAERFWMLRLLQQEVPANKSLKAYVLRCDQRFPLLELADYGVSTLLKMDKPKQGAQKTGSSALQVGDIIDVQIRDIQPFSLGLAFTLPEGSPAAS